MIKAKTGLKKRQKITEIYFSEADNAVDIFTHNTDLKNRLSAFADKFPTLCRCTDDDGFGGMRFEIDRSRFSIRLTKPYSAERKSLSAITPRDRKTNSKERSNAYVRR